MDNSISLFEPVHFQHKGSLVWFITLSVSFTEILTFNANSVDPDQTLNLAAPDHGPHRLSRSPYWDAKH